MRGSWVLALGLIAAGCGTGGTNTGSAENSGAANGAAPASAVNARATAALAAADGQARGSALAAPHGNGVRLTVEAQGLDAGIYGVHLHQAGRCDGPRFESAGPHWNPTNRQHGRENPAGAHLGDLPNLEVSNYRRGTISFTIEGATLSGGANALLDADGAAVMIHARPDDYRTDPSGDSGDRIVCGVLTASG